MAKCYTVTIANHSKDYPDTIQCTDLKDLYSNVLRNTRKLVSTDKTEYTYTNLLSELVLGLWIITNAPNCRDRLSTYLSKNKDKQVRHKVDQMITLELAITYADTDYDKSILKEILLKLARELVSILPEELIDELFIRVAESLKGFNFICEDVYEEVEE